MPLFDISPADETRKSSDLKLLNKQQQKTELIKSTWRLPWSKPVELEDISVIGREEEKRLYKTPSLNEQPSSMQQPEFTEDPQKVKDKKYKEALAGITRYREGEFFSSEPNLSAEEPFKRNMEKIQESIILIEGEPAGSRAAMVAELIKTIEEVKEKILSVETKIEQEIVSSVKSRKDEDYNRRKLVIIHQYQDFLQRAIAQADSLKEGNVAIVELTNTMSAMENEQNKKKSYYEQQRLKINEKLKKEVATEPLQSAEVKGLAVAFAQDVRDKILTNFDYPYFTSLRTEIKSMTDAANYIFSDEEVSEAEKKDLYTQLSSWLEQKYEVAFEAYWLQSADEGGNRVTYEKIRNENKKLSSVRLREYCKLFIAQQLYELKSNYESTIKKAGGK
ncbi:MAG: hypothetical protein WCE21_00435 [Candidatus Babeliales bacterium]